MSENRTYEIQLLQLCVNSGDIVLKSCDCISLQEESNKRSALIFFFLVKQQIQRSKIDFSWKLFPVYRADT